MTAASETCNILPHKSRRTVITSVAIRTVVLIWVMTQCWSLAGTYRCSEEPPTYPTDDGTKFFRNSGYLQIQKPHGNLHCWWLSGKCLLCSVQCKSKGKIKCTLVQALRLCTGRTAHRGSWGIALLFHDHGTRRGWGVVTPRPLFTPGKDPVSIVQEAGWASGPLWTGAENLAPYRDSIPGPSSP